MTKALPSVMRMLVMGVGQRSEGMLDKTVLLKQLSEMCDVSESSLIKVSGALYFSSKRCPYNALDAHAYPVYHYCYCVCVCVCVCV